MWVRLTSSNDPAGSVFVNLDNVVQIWKGEGGTTVIRTTAVDGQKPYVITVLEAPEDVLRSAGVQWNLKPPR